MSEWDIHDANSLVERDIWFAFEGNGVVWLFSKPFSVSLDAIVIFIDPYYYVSTNVPNDYYITIWVATYQLSHCGAW